MILIITIEERPVAPTDIAYFPNSHTGDNIAAALRDVLINWNLPEDKQVSITTDNGANVVKAAEVNNWVRLQCFGHRLHLAIENAVKVLHVFNTCVLAAKEQESDLTKSIKKKILDYLNSKYDDPATQELLDMACFMDPRFKAGYVSGDKLHEIKS
uniref:Transposase n=1 Tax=Knipowitschia caucasica TaxID=637954 RepID=A0AAV2M168_KNICA